MTDSLPPHMTDSLPPHMTDSLPPHMTDTLPPHRHSKRSEVSNRTSDVLQSPQPHHLNTSDSPPPDTPAQLHQRPRRRCVARDIPVLCVTRAEAHKMVTRGELARSNPTQLNTDGKTRALRDISDSHVIEISPSSDAPSPDAPSLQSSSPHSSSQPSSPSSNRHAPDRTSRLKNTSNLSHLAGDLQTVLSALAGSTRPPSTCNAVTTTVKQLGPPRRVKTMTSQDRRGSFKDDSREEELRRRSAEFANTLPLVVFEGKDTPPAPLKGRSILTAHLNATHPQQPHSSSSMMTRGRSNTHHLSTMRQTPRGSHITSERGRSKKATNVAKTREDSKLRYVIKGVSRSRGGSKSGDP
eukprot:GHVN01083211.1.p1 GENE.GHVN01083211.1~~GHVN01083211.1.p1  ORF type:complete len:364 (+),score=122.12 GHVN01083211.1:35-1093(+)